MDWKTPKNKIYAWDGGWLDIYVHKNTSKDWKQWVQFVNQQLRISIIVFIFVLHAHIRYVFR
jgi:hypothetical protein